MTAYFDERKARVNELRKRPDGGDAWLEEVDALEREVVWDVTQAAACLGMPPDIRDRIHRAVICYQVVTLPHGADMSEIADRLTPPEHIAQMIDALHTIFHDLARRRVPGFSDSPRTPMVRRYDDEEDYREKLRPPARGGR